MCGVILKLILNLKVSEENLNHIDNLFIFFEFNWTLLMCINCEKHFITVEKFTWYVYVPYFEHYVISTQSSILSSKTINK